MPDLDFDALRALADASTSASRNAERAITTDGMIRGAEESSALTMRLGIQAREAVPALLDIRDAVLALHAPREVRIPGHLSLDLRPKVVRVCSMCKSSGDAAESWPCATARACGVDS